MVAIQNKINDPDIYDIYVGTEMKVNTYDGSNWVDDTGKYDLRLRPWYIQAKAADRTRALC